MSSQLNKEQNFLSVVLVSHNSEKEILIKLDQLVKVLESRFKYYEIIVVDNFSKDKTLELLNQSSHKITIVELSKRHNSQQALRAGMDIAIGDFLLEVENINQTSNFEVILDLYEECLKGNDFVFYSSNTSSLTSKAFYHLINRYYKRRLDAVIGSSSLVLSSRRGQNKTIETGSVIVNRNVSYLLSGLSCSVIQHQQKYRNGRGMFENIDLFVDTLIHYTDLIPKTATMVSFLFAFISFVFMVYGFVMYATVGTTEGWASTNIFLSVSFAGVFLMLGLLSKYLLNILNVSKQTKPYTFRSVTKK